MKTNPFVYGKEVSGENFYDRKEDFEMLVSTLAGGSANVVLYAPRRYGKTSLAKKALEELPFVERAEVSHENGTAALTLSGTLDEEAVKAAVEERDYTFLGIEEQQSGL